MLSGASMRYRFYTAMGCHGEELSQIVVSYTVTFWLGLAGTGRAQSCLTRRAICSARTAKGWSVAIGWLLLCAVIAYLGATACAAGPGSPSEESRSMFHGCRLASGS
jgi:hypothetical protein